MGRKLFVGNLNFATTSDDLRTLFAEMGTCERATVMTDRVTGRSRGFGFVEMSTDEEAQKAIEELNGREFQGRNLNVNEARERTPGAPRPGGYAGAGGGGGYAGGGGGGYGAPRSDGPPRGGGDFNPGGGFRGGFDFPDDHGGGGGLGGGRDWKPRKDGGSRRGLRARKRSL
jgi:RNA recognition motif-containing protein